MLLTQEDAVSEYYILLPAPRSIENKGTLMEKFWKASLSQEKHLCVMVRKTLTQDSHV